MSTPESREDRPYGAITPLRVSGDLTAVRADLLADEAATLALVLAGLRALRPELDRAATLDTMGTPREYRHNVALLDELIGNLDGLRDTREWADIDRRIA